MTATPDDSTLDAKKTPPAWPLCVVVVVVALAAFAPLWNGPYSPLDDLLMLNTNPRYTPPSWHSLWQNLTEPAFRIYVPLTAAVWHGIAALTYQPGVPFGTLPTVGFKIASILTHAAAVAAAFGVALRLLRSRWPAALVAIVFALHPIQVEPVAWTTGLKDELCGLFVLLTLGAYLTFLETGRRKWRSRAIGLSILAVASKPTAITLPIILAAADLFLTDRPLKKRWRSIWPFAVVAAIGTIIILRIQGDPTVEVPPLIFRPMVALDSLAFYMAKFVWPFGFSVDYGRTYATTRASGVIYWSWILPVIAGTLVVLSRDRLLWLGGVIFVAPLLPVLGAVPFDMQQYSTVADHYAYQSAFGVGLILARLAVRINRPHLATTGGALLSVVLAILCVRHVLLWRDMPTLMRASLAVNPDSAMLKLNLSVDALRNGDAVAAERYARLAVDRHYIDATLDQLTISLAAQGKQDEAAVWASRTLDLPIDKIELPRVRWMFELARKQKDAVLAEKALKRWREMDPNEPFARDRLREIQRSTASRPASAP